MSEFKISKLEKEALQKLLVDNSAIHGSSDPGWTPAIVLVNMAKKKWIAADPHPHHYMRTYYQITDLGRTIARQLGIEVQP